MNSPIPTSVTLCTCCGHVAGTIPHAKDCDHNYVTAVGLFVETECAECKGKGRVPFLRFLGKGSRMYPEHGQGVTGRCTGCNMKCRVPVFLRWSAAVPLLAHLIAPSPPPASEKPEDSAVAIGRIVAQHFGLSFADLQGEGRSRSTVLARHHAMWEIRHRLGLSYPEIGRMFHRSHDAVLRPVRGIDERLKPSHPGSPHAHCSAPTVARVAALKPLLAAFPPFPGELL